MLVERWAFREEVLRRCPKRPVGEAGAVSDQVWNEVEKAMVAWGRAVQAWETHDRIGGDPAHYDPERHFAMRPEWLRVREASWRERERFFDEASEHVGRAFRLWQDREQ
jgi:hypothetical protein